MSTNRYKNLESSEIGRDMFDNDVRIGQKVLYMRADPGGVGIGEVIDIRISNKATKDKPLKEYIGYRYGYSSKKSVDKIFCYKLKTEGKIETYKYNNEIISSFNSFDGEHYFGKKYE